MPNGRKLLLYGLLGLLLSVAVSSFLYWVVYPHTIRTIITKDTIHKGDLVISGDQEFTVEGVTYLNDGNIIVQDQAKLTLKNAVLIINQSDPKSWFGGSEPSIEEPISYPLYYLNLRDDAQFEAFNSIIKTPTAQHFKLWIEGKAKVVLSQTNITETLHFMDDSIGTITASYMESMSLSGNSVVSISDSILPQSWFFLSQNAVVSISNSTTTRGGAIHAWSYFGTMYFDQTRLRATLRAENSSFRISGGVTFQEGSGISHIVRDDVIHWNWENSDVTRSYDIVIVRANGVAFANVSLSLYNRLGNLLWSGLTDNQGRATVEATFTTENFLDSFELVAAAEGWNLKGYLTLLSATPVYISSNAP